MAVCSIRFIPKNDDYVFLADLSGVLSNQFNFWKSIFPLIKE